MRRVRVPLPHYPFHPPHPLILLPNYPYLGSCNFFERRFRGFAYRCDSCDFDLHGTCALLQVSVASNFPTCLHQHPLFFVQNHDEEVINDCCGCKNPLSGPIYHCSDCTYPTIFNLHKKCAESSLEIQHPYDRKHPLTLLSAPAATHRLDCSCYLCKIQWDGFVYSCSICNFDLTLDDFLAPKEITFSSHGHHRVLLLKQISFVCDSCGIAGDHSPYLYIMCNLVVHKKCISMPRNIMITRHHHVISHSFYLQEDQFEDWMCRICYEEVDMRYGGCCCSNSDCIYIFHVHCATNKAIWDGTIISEVDERCKEAPCEYRNLITDGVEQMSIGEDMVAVEIKKCVS
ncbi:hypothetical protein F3Y22_tig00110831pilonHSYRG00159 [Hibiscus syriacus]|uniref:DC1 domain-containing protein n=1 Tax=Hibiscus syriacus TaxID=106335 RepID=A0A6A2ZMA1_HIBSY|nr:uncharacterized protein LOC120142659 [Hibiscus syriacus]KAE8692607.1 hypothetical protein F3Y22_tig00110831pilonHSYRG00159 [Hibiscus syriacus]